MARSDGSAAPAASRTRRWECARAPAKGSIVGRKLGGDLAVDRGCAALGVGLNRDELFAAQAPQKPIESAALRRIAKQGVDVGAPEDLRQARVDPSDLFFHRTRRPPLALGRGWRRRRLWRRGSRRHGPLGLQRRRAGVAQEAPDHVERPHLRLEGGLHQIQAGAAGVLEAVLGLLVFVVVHVVRE